MHQLGLALSLLVSLGIVGYLAWQLDWRAFAAELHRLNWWYLPGLVLLLLAVLWLRALRWRYLLPQGGQLSIRRLAEATVLGFFASFVLPLRAGEFIRPWVLSRLQPVPLPTALASIVAERCLDALSLLAFLGLCLRGAPAMPDFVLAGARTVGVIAALLLAVLILCRVRPAAATGLAHRFARRVIEPRFPHLAGRFVGIIDAFVDGLRGVSRPWHLAAAVFYSFLVWLLMAAWYQVAMWMFGEHPSWWVGMVLNVMIAMAVAAPSAPGFIGTFQAGCVLALAVIFPYSREFAVAYSLVTHLVQTVVVLVAGFAVLQGCGLRWATLRQPPAGAELPKK